MKRSSIFVLLRVFARSLPRFSLGNLMVAGTLFMMACNSSGGLGCDYPPCTHAWDGTPGSCPLPGVPDRQIGGACQGVYPCVGNATCVDGTCLACGGAGQVCCTWGDAACSAGTCASSGDFPTCDPNCGLLTPGKDSCCGGTGTQCTQGVCDIDTNKCVQPGSDPCTGMLDYSVYLTDDNGCAIGPVFFTSNNDAEAQTCADQYKASYGAQSTCGLHQQPQETDVCGTSLLGSFDYHIEVCDSAQFASCQAAKCENCTFEMGACP